MKYMCNPDAIYKAKYDHKGHVIECNEFQLWTLKRYFKPYRKGNNKKMLNNLIVADTETTVEFNEDNTPKRGYICAWGIVIDGTLFMGRKVETFLEFINKMNHIVKDCNFDMTWHGSTKNVKDSNGVSLDQPLMKIYFHNSGYDWTFLSLFFPNSICFGGEKVNPITVTNYENNFIINDSYKLLGKSLKSCLKDWNITFEKDSDKWDYNKIRKPDTPLDEDEIDYLADDVIGLHQVLQKKCNRDYKGDVAAMPLTKTSEVRHAVKDIGNKVEAQEFDLDSFKTYFKFDNFINPKSYTRKDLQNKTYFIDKDYYVYKKIKSKLIKMKQIEYDGIKLVKMKNKMTFDVYKQALIMSQNAFAGGFVHANRNALGVTLEDVISNDLTSAYPAICFTKRFAFLYKRTEIRKSTEMDKDKQYLMEVTFYNIRAKKMNNDDENFTVLSKHKAMKKSYDGKDYNINIDELDNGRILRAKECTFTLYKDEYLRLKTFYEWDDVKFSNVLEAPYQYLPRTLILVSNYYYELKTVLKVQLGIAEEEYKTNKTEELRMKCEKLEGDLKYAKQQLNSIYGCMATNPLKYITKEDILEGLGFVNVDIEDLNDEDTQNVEEKFKEKQEDNYKKLFRSRNIIDFLFGPQITCLNRCKIFDALEIFGMDNCWYCDTDSIKMKKDISNAQELLNKINKDITIEVDNCLKDNHIDDSNWYVKGKRKTIGIFDPDGEYKWFKTLGAKKYIYWSYTKDGTPEYEKDGVTPCLHCTVAGISKNSIKAYLMKEGKNTIQGAFRKFNGGLSMSEEETNKNTHTYVNNEEIKVWDDGISVGSYIVIQPTTFEMNLLKSGVQAMINKHLRLLLDKEDKLIEM